MHMGNDMLFDKLEQAKTNIGYTLKDEKFLVQK